MLLAKQGSQITFFVPCICVYNSKNYQSRFCCTYLRLCEYSVVQLESKTNDLNFHFTTKKTTTTWKPIYRFLHDTHTHEFTFILHIVWSSSQHLSFEFFFNISAVKNQPIEHCYFHSLRFNVMIAIRTVYRYWFIGIYYLKYRIQYELHIDALN